jgi:hypothetical protein
MICAPAAPKLSIKNVAESNLNLDVKENLLEASCVWSFYLD